MTMELASSTVIDVVKEAAGLLSTNLTLLSFTTLLLLFPVASLALSQAVLLADATTNLWAHLPAFHQRAALETPLGELVYRHVPGALLAQALRFPVVLTLGLLAKAAVLYVLDRRRRGSPSSLTGILRAGPSTWARLAATHLCISLLLLGLAGLALLAPLVAAGFARHLHVAVAAPLIETPLLLALSVALAHVLASSGLAHVAAAMPGGPCGPGAVRKSVFLLMRLRALQAPALLLFLATTLCATLVEAAFQFRILARGGSLWEAPLLIAFYSFISLFDTLMSFVFYHVCQSAAEDYSSCCDELSPHNHQYHDHHEALGPEHQLLCGLALMDQPACSKSNHLSFQYYPV